MLVAGEYGVLVEHSPQAVGVGDARCPCAPGTSTAAPSALRGLDEPFSCDAAEPVRVERDVAREVWQEGK